MSEQVNHPQHYGGKDNPFEAIKVIEAWDLDFCLGNAVKYISRAAKKGEESLPFHTLVRFKGEVWENKEYIVIFGRLVPSRFRSDK